MIDWSQYAVGGATRPDAISGLDAQFQNALARMIAEAPETVRAGLRLSSAYRSPERQEQLWQEALAKYGSPEAARKWVAPPGRSQHNHGRAADLKYLSPEARAWAHENAARYGLAFPLSNEDWHIELASARGGEQPPSWATSSGPPSQNALAAMPQEPQRREQNALAAMEWADPLDARAFMSRRQFAPAQPVMAERVNYLTRYL